MDEGPRGESTGETGVDLHAVEQERPVGHGLEPDVALSGQQEALHQLLGPQIQRGESGHRSQKP